MRNVTRGLVVAAAAATIVVAKSAAREAEPARAGVADPIAEYEQCKGKPATERCAALRGVVRYRVIEALVKLQRARDRRGVQPAVAVLSLPDEPAIHMAAMRVIAPHADDAGVGEAVAPLLFSPYPDVQGMAAEILRRGRHEGRRRLAEQWRRGHPRTSYDIFPTELAPPPPDPRRIGFAPYPGAERFHPGDLDRAVGWMTGDSVSKVAAFYERELGTKALDGPRWAARANQLRDARLATAPDPSQDPDVKELERLIEEYQRTGDPKVLQKIQALSEKVAKKLEAAQPEPILVLEVDSPPHEEGWRGARVFPTETVDGGVERLLVVYREEAIGKTVIHMIWDPRIRAATRRTSCADARGERVRSRARAARSAGKPQLSKQRPTSPPERPDGFSAGTRPPRRREHRTSAAGGGVAEGRERQAATTERTKRSRLRLMPRNPA